ncbi:MAG: hypothetical protein E6H79_19765, partial [Betaproteobacteria bacterium]
MPRLARPKRSVVRAATLTPLAAALCLAGAHAQSEEPGPALQMTPRLSPLPRGDAGNELPTIVRGNEIRSRPDLETVVEGS